MTDWKKTVHRAPHHFSPFHLCPAGDPGERTGEDQGGSLNPQTLLNMQRTKSCSLPSVTSDDIMTMRTDCVCNNRLTTRLDKETLQGSDLVSHVGQSTKEYKLWCGLIPNVGQCVRGNYSITSGPRLWRAAGCRFFFILARKIGSGLNLQWA